MSNEPKVTRFGADPTVDQELATKAYVDGQQHLNFFYLTEAGGDNNPQDAELWAYGESQGNTARDFRENDILFNATFQEHSLRVGANAHDSTVTWTFQIEAVSTSTVISVATGLTGTFFVTADDSITDRERFNYIISFGGSGNFDTRCFSARGTID